jgi:O-succinylhomoserine sulfhydrylase
VHPSQKKKNKNYTTDLQTRIREFVDKGVAMEGAETGYAFATRNVFLIFQHLPLVNTGDHVFLVVRFWLNARICLPNIYQNGDSKTSYFKGG